MFCPTKPLPWLGALLLCALPVHAAAQALSYELAADNASWPDRATIVSAMAEAAATYNGLGFFEKRVRVNYNAGVPTAQGNYNGTIDFGGQRNTRVAIHELAHVLGIGQVNPFNGGAWSESSAAGRLIKLYEGRAAVLNTGGTHFWPYGLNYDNEDGPAARERHVKLVSAFRFDMGVVKDSDSDGLPDDWETFHFMNLAQTGDGDSDGDGINNRDEYASDSDPKKAAPVRDGHSYVLRMQLGKRVLSVAGTGLAEGAVTELREADGSARQQWLVRYRQQGFFSFENAESGLVLEVQGTDTASGRPIRLASWTGAPQQQWRIAAGPGADEGHYQVANRETARVFDGLDGVDGAQVKQYPFLGNLPQQFWRFEELTVGADAGAASGDASVSDASVSDAGLGGAGLSDGSTGGAAGDAGGSAPLTPRDGSVGVDGAIAEGDTDPRGESGCAVSAPGAPGLAAPLWFALFALVGLARRRSSAS